MTVNKFLYLLWHVIYPTFIGALGIVCSYSLTEAIKSGGCWIWPVAGLVFCGSAFVSLLIINFQELNNKED